MTRAAQEKTTKSNKITTGAIPLTTIVPPEREGVARIRVEELVTVITWPSRNRISKLEIGAAQLDVPEKHRHLGETGSTAAHTGIATATWPVRYAQVSTRPIHPSLARELLRTSACRVTCKFRAHKTTSNLLPCPSAKWPPRVMDKPTSARMLRDFRRNSSSSYSNACRVTRKRTFLTCNKGTFHWGSKCWCCSRDRTHRLIWWLRERTLLTI